jgi:hypothetical protein
MSDAQKKDARIKQMNAPQPSDLYRQLTSAKRVLKTLLAQEDAETVDILIACQTYLNKSIEEVEKLFGDR